MQKFFKYFCKKDLIYKKSGSADDALPPYYIRGVVKFYLLKSLLSNTCLALPIERSMP